MKLPPAMKSDECRAALVEYKRTGDVTHRNRAVRGCMRFVMSRARHYGRHGRNLDDLMQAGCEGLLRAFEAYDPERSAPLTHAARWIDRFIIDHMTASHRMVVSSRAFSRIQSVVDAVEGGAGTIDEVVEATRLARVAAGKPASRGMYHDAAAGIMTLLSGHDVGDEFVSLQSDVPRADDALDTATRGHAVRVAVEALPPSQRDAVIATFWLEDTPTKAGRIRGVSRQAIDNATTIGLDKLRKQLREVA